MSGSDSDHFHKVEYAADNTDEDRVRFGGPAVSY